MGGGGSTESAPAVDHESFSAEEYESLRVALKVKEDLPTTQVELPAFLACFQPHLRPLIQPLFFKLARSPVGEPSSSWPVLVASLSGLVRRSCTWRGLLKIWAASDEVSADVHLYVELAASLCFWCAYPSLSPSKAEGSDAGSDVSLALDAFVTVLKSVTTDATDIADAAKRLDEAASQLPRALAPHLSYRLLGATVPPERHVQAESRILDLGLALLLQSMQAGLWQSGPWQPLFRDWKDGRSFNGLLAGALHYEGPALVLIRTSEGQVIGALSSCWTEGNGKFAGGPDATLFSLSPKLGVFPSVSRSGNWVYLNSRNTYCPRGLGFGGQLNFYRLWLDADFEECSVLEGDATYASGPLLPPSGLQTKFQPTVIEIWGCGGEEAAAAQHVQRQRDEGLRDQARKVDRAKLIENEFDKEVLFAHTFQATADVREQVEQARGTDE